MALKKKLTRKELLNQQDEFISFSSHVANLIREQGRLVVVGLFAMFGVGLLVGVSYLYQQHNHDQARILEEAAYNAYHGQVIGASESAQAVNQGTIYTTSEEKYKAAQVKYQELLEKYPDSLSAKRARLYVGLCAYYLGEYGKAKKAFQRFLDEAPQDSIWYQQALHNLGYAQEEGKDYLEAAQTYQRLADVVPKASKPLIYLDIARAYEQANAWSQARQTYENMRQFVSMPEQEAMIGDKIRRLDVKSKLNLTDNDQGKQ